jgi:putative acetyltransferase
MEIRAEKPEDIEAIRRINIAAFDGQSEANLVDQLRGIASTSSFVAVEFEHVVGHIFFSPVTISGNYADDPGFLGLAPVAVLPDHQGQGIGSFLIRHGLTECARLGFKAVVVLGSPTYYRRFGFIPAQAKGLRCEFPVPDEAFMVLELEHDALAGCTGIVKYRSEFDMFK